MSSGLALRSIGIRWGYTCHWETRALYKPIDGANKSHAKWHLYSWIPEDEIHSQRSEAPVPMPSSFFWIKLWGTVTYLTDCGAPTLILDCKNSVRPSETSQIYGTISGPKFVESESKVFFLERPTAYTYSQFILLQVSSYIICSIIPQWRRVSKISAEQLFLHPWEAFLVRAMMKRLQE